MNLDIIGRVAQTAAPLWIYNVWFNRFDKDTGYRGGDAKNMKEEFAEYGLPESVMYATGALKVGLATAMLAGHVVPKLTRPASSGLAVLMVGAVGMHAKAGDPFKRYIPALSMLAATAAAAIINAGAE